LTIWSGWMEVCQQAGPVARRAAHRAACCGLSELSWWLLSTCQAGLARFPNNPTVLLVYANYIIHVKKEPRAARQQLQLASKGEGTMFDRYAIFTGNVSSHTRSTGCTNCC
jgi:hypothetical protein